MDRNIKHQEVKNYQKLAVEFLDNAKELKKLKRFRGVVDDAYNALELCLKAFILLKMDTLPQRHSGIVQKFSEFYIKTEKFESDLGPSLRKVLRLRNLARYEPSASMTSRQADDVLCIAKKLLTHLREYFQRSLKDVS